MAVKWRFKHEYPANSNHDRVQTPCQRGNKTRNNKKKNVEKCTEAHKYAERKDTDQKMLPTLKASLLLNAKAE